ncbi:MAG: helix-turn-helix domain-containing protein [Giesbergeria sp.]
MNFFSDSLARLKHYLRVSKDQEVATALGLSKTAFSERKKRGAFPEKELRALAQQRPDLGIDVEYVLSGQQPVAAKPAWLRLKAELGVHEDAAAAAWLRMDMAAVNAYTARGVFPVQQFLTACETRSELVDRDFVLTGVGMAAHSLIDDVRKSLAAGSDPEQERQIIYKYRNDTLFRQAVDALFAMAARPEKALRLDEQAN